MSFRDKIKDLYLRSTQYKWTVGVAEYDESVILSKDRKLKIHWIKDRHKGSWFADPFILSVSDDYVFILVEEVMYDTGKGRISKLTVDRHDWRLLKIEPLLSISTHLSFPNFYRKNGRVYIFPESTSSGRLTLYEYDEDSGSIREVNTLCDSPVADAVLFNHNGKDVILGTTSPEDNGRVLDVYSLPDAVTGESSIVQKISFPTRVARNAGRVFTIDGKNYRPAQDCSKAYGECVVIQEMENVDGTLTFNEVRRFYSHCFNHWVAFHTFNVYENQYIAVDAEGFRSGLFGWAVSKVRNWFKK